MRPSHHHTANIRALGILLFDGVEVLDFAGPFEVFSVAGELHPGLVSVVTVAERMRPVTTVNGLSVNPAVDFGQAPSLDVLVVPGGAGTRALLTDKGVLGWVARTHAGAQHTLSICSGARLFAALGLLDGKPYCTHHEVYPHLAELVPTGMPQPKRRFVKSNDTLYTSGGISAGIDLSFHVLAKIAGHQVAQATADYMEYRWSPEGG
ncbi:MAG: DJ-1/PfpI family protein [Rhodothermales bacterium]